MKDFGALVEECARNPWFFGQVFFRRWLSQEASFFHYGLLAILTRRISWLEELNEDIIEKIVGNFVWKEDVADEESPEHPVFFWEEDLGRRFLCMSLRPITGIMVPRGFAKTTIIKLAILFNSVFAERKFQVMISETASVSTLHIKSIRNEFESNEKLREVFGEMVPGQRQGLTWTDDLLELNNGCAIMGRSRGSQVRGLIIRNERPDLIVLDDVEDKESVNTAVQRKKTLDWLYEDVMPAVREFVAEGYVESQIVVAGTLLHAEAMLMKLCDDMEVTGIKLAAFDKDGDPLWPAVWPAEKLAARRERYARAGKLAGYYREYHSQLRSPEEAPFNKDLFIYVVGKFELTKALAIDPAIGDDPNRNDMCALGVVGMENGGPIHVLDVMGRVGMSPRDQIDAYFELYEKWSPLYCGVESIAYQRALIYELKTEMFARGIYFDIVPITHGNVAKTDRVEGILQPRFAAGYLRFARRFPDLEQQLLDWPNGLKDLPDVVAMCIALLDPVAGMAFVEREDQKKARADSRRRKQAWKSAV